MAVCSLLNQLTLAFVGATGGMAMRLISARELKEKLDLVAIGLMSAEEAKDLETSAAGTT